MQLLHDNCNIGLYNPNGNPNNSVANATNNFNVYPSSDGDNCAGYRLGWMLGRRI
jgi:hypothetical protein